MLFDVVLLVCLPGFLSFFSAEGTLHVNRGGGAVRLETDYAAAGSFYTNQHGGRHIAFATETKFFKGHDCFF